MRRRLWRNREFIWPVVLAGTVTWCSGSPAVAVESAWFEPDKVAHFAVYGALATAVVRWRRWENRRWRGALAAAALATAYGLGDEFRQSVSGVRVFDLHDWAADAAGAAVAVLLYAGWPAYRRLMEMPLRRAKGRAEIAAPLIENAAP